MFCEIYQLNMVYNTTEFGKIEWRQIDGNIVYINFDDQVIT